MRWLVVAAVCGACGAEPDVPAARRERLALIRDVSAAAGISNGALIAGIAESETHVVQCWRDARYACMGPASPSCDGEPVIAGSADGPCEAQQGGLGMFQLDAGTWADTLALYGEDVLASDGNAARAVDFVIDRVARELALPPADAIAWINGVPLVAGDATLERWGQLMACRYNGCCAATPTCASRAAGYRDNALAVTAQLGAGFWSTSR